MKVYVLEREQLVRAPADAVFEFFADAGNLQTITPPWLGFEFVTPMPIEMKVDARIEYRLKLAGVPLRWRTRISRWEPGRGFVDEQERGPYALWEHTHRFEVTDRGVWVSDRVRYALPLGPLGRIAHALAVHSALHRIFDFRFQRTRELLEGGDPG
ncbi:MAG: SRPBCC family protein [Myxococcales bacterium]|nr:SRPBCC family protein [Myxococcales bacterium]